MGNYIDIQGQRFGRLVVLRKVLGGWFVRCDCGAEKPVIGTHLRKGRVRSCGCLKSEQMSLPPGRAARNKVLAKYRKQAKQRGHCWELPSEKFDELTAQICHYCGLSPSNTARHYKSVFVYNGIDRKDNSKGYIEVNVVPCCKTCNRLKKSMSYDDFVTYLNRVSAFRQARGASV